MSMVTAAIIGGGASLIGGLFGMGSAKKAERAAKREAAQLGAQLEKLEKSRQAVINPYAGTKDLSSLVTDTSAGITNQFANLGVATKAAEMQIETADISLANTLDTLRETGSSAGGATALAQAALKSKQGVTASIEAQEAENEKMRAQGEQQLQQVKMAEAQRIQGAQLSEGQRVQAADAAGQAFMFNATEDRQTQQLNRVAGQMSGAQQRAAQAKSDGIGSLTGAIGAVGGIAGAYMMGKGKQG